MGKLETLVGLIVLLAGSAGVYWLFQHKPQETEEVQQIVETEVGVQVTKVR